MIEDAATKPMVLIIANDNWVEFTLRYVADYKMRVIVKDHLFTKVLEKAENSSSQVQLASTTFELVGTSSTELKQK